MFRCTKRILAKIDFIVFVNNASKFNNGKLRIFVKS